MTLPEFLSWQAFSKAKSAELDRAGKGAALPVLADMPAAAIGRAIAGR